MTFLKNGEIQDGTSSLGFGSVKAQLNKFTFIR